MVYPCIFLFLSLALGIILGKFLDLKPLFLIPALCLSLVLSFFFYKKRRLLLSDILILLLFFFLGILWIRPYAGQLPKEVLRGKVSLYAQVASPPKESGGFTSYRSASNYVIGSGKKIYFPGPIGIKDYNHEPVSYLDYYLFRGKLRYTTYGRPGYTFYISGEDRPLKVKRSLSVLRPAYAFGRRIASLFEDNMSSEASSFIVSIFLGRRQDLSYDTQDIFRQAGTSHVLAISGLHTGIVAGIFLFILKVAGLRRKPRYLIAALIVLGYAFLCGLKTPVVRASIMFICWSLSFFLRRRSSIFNILGLSGMINLFLRPADIFSVSFQLSYIAVFSIAVGFKYFYPVGLSGGFMNKVKALFLSSVFVNLGLMPLVSFYWGKIYILSIFSNLIVIPYLGLIISSLFVFLGLYIVYPFRVFLSASCQVLVLFFLRLNDIFSQMPLSYLEYRFSPTAIAVYYVAIIALVVISKKIPRPY